MRYTFRFGAPVRRGEHHLGSLERVIVNNGIANQFTVNPSGLFSGPERIVPINDVVESSDEGITLNITEVDWKAYPAFNIDHYLVSDQAAAPGLMVNNPRIDTTTETFDQTTTEGQSSDSTVDMMAIPLSRKTRVGDGAHLAGLIAETGIPQQLLLEDGTAIPFDQVGRLDETHIVLGQTTPRMDSAVQPGALGTHPAPMDHPTSEGSLAETGADAPGSRPRRGRARQYSTD
jgi:hypothetical protein